VADKEHPCAHPDICPAADDFAARVKTEKLALEPPPPADLTDRPRKNRR
jgi:hypothetical protein